MGAVWTVEKSWEWALAAGILLVLTLAQNAGFRRGAKRSLLASDWSMVTILSSDWLMLDTRSMREIS